MYQTPRTASVSIHSLTWLSKFYSHSRRSTSAFDAFSSHCSASCSVSHRPHSSLDSLLVSHVRSQRHSVTHSFHKPFWALATISRTEHRNFLLSHRNSYYAISFASSIRCSCSWHFILLYLYCIWYHSIMFSSDNTTYICLEAIQLTALFNNVWKSSNTLHVSQHISLLHSRHSARFCYVSTDRPTVSALPSSSISSHHTSGPLTSQE